MPLSALLTVDVIEALENYLERNRPPVEIRKKLDLGYMIDGPSVLIFEIRPAWNNPSVIREHPVAKTTYIKTKQQWKVLWRRAIGNWESYKPNPMVKTIHAFIKLVEDDKYACFFG